MALFAVPVFFGACLLLVVEPMLAKWMLPALGGSPATWAACMVFFQGALLAGYAYAHFGAARFATRVQVRVHAALIVAAAFALVRARSPEAPTFGPLGPTLGVPWLLLRQVGLPYFALASTTPLLQYWAAKALGRPPYALYALSNAGSLVGLLAYPFLLEPNLGVNHQLSLWGAAFIGFGAVMLSVCVRMKDVPEGERVIDRTSREPPPRAGRRVAWLAYAFVPSVVLLAATNHITVDVAATPVLWVVPLALYLASFIVVFGGFQPRRRGALLVVWFVSALMLGMNAFEQAAAPLWRQLGATLLGLSTASLLCHGELAQDRPHPEYLTGYYLIIATGGVLGGAFVSYVAPFVFTDYYELELGALATCLVLLASAYRRGPRAWSRSERSIALVGVGLAVPVLIGTVLVRVARETNQGKIVERRRSFLGPLRVVDTREGRLLTHGRIQHGMQLKDPAMGRVPTLYFGAGTALARVFEVHHAERPRRVGVVGLGTGTIAAYGRPGDVFRFYELDPNVTDIAQTDFTFLSDSSARIEIVSGDGRLSLSKERQPTFDLLILDAFSSDSVPVHLLTREAFSMYLENLAPDGLLLANVSNRYLAVDRVVRGSARALGLACAVQETPTDAPHHVSHVAWAIVARDPKTIAALGSDVARSISVGAAALWTDDRANLWSILR